MYFYYNFVQVVTCIRKKKDTHTIKNLIGNCYRNRALKNAILNNKRNRKWFRYSSSLIIKYYVKLVPQSYI